MTSAPKIIDQELAQFGWVESLAVNSISDFKSNNFDWTEETNEEKSSDFFFIFVCHLIFYVIFCYSLFLYIVFDLGLGEFVQNNLTKLIKYAKGKKKISILLTPSS